MVRSHREIHNLSESHGKANLLVSLALLILYVVDSCHVWYHLHLYWHLLSLFFTCESQTFSTGWRGSHGVPRHLSKDLPIRLIYLFIRDNHVIRCPCCGRSLWPTSSCTFYRFLTGHDCEFFTVPECRLMEHTCHQRFQLGNWMRVLMESCVGIFANL